MEFEFKGIHAKNLHNNLPAIIAKRAMAGMYGKYPYALVDFEIVMKAARAEHFSGRIFRVLDLTLAVPAFDKHWHRKVPLELPEGQSVGEAKFISASLPLDFVEPAAATLEITFLDSGQHVGTITVPIEFSL